LKVLLSAANFHPQLWREENEAKPFDLSTDVQPVFDRKELNLRHFANNNLMLVRKSTDYEKLVN
jgi:hypothetical protein